MHTFSNFITEKRRNSEVNFRQTLYQELEKYKNDPTIHITFTRIEKVGVNVKTGDGRTPSAVYTYPLKQVWSEFDHSGGKVVVPFSPATWWVYVLKATKPPFIVERYSKSDLTRDVAKLKSICTKTFKLSSQEFDEFVAMITKVDTSHPKYDHPWTTLKHIIMGIGNKFKSFSGSTAPSSGVPMSAALTKYYRILGFDHVQDNGSGLIHIGEPTQAFFLTPKSYKVIDKISKNDKNKGIETADEILNEIIRSHRSNVSFNVGRSDTFYSSDRTVSVSEKHKVYDILTYTNIKQILAARSNENERNLFMGQVYDLVLYYPDKIDSKIAGMVYNHVKSVKKQNPLIAIADAYPNPGVDKPGALKWMMKFATKSDVAEYEDWLSKN